MKLFEHIRHPYTPKNINEIHDDQLGVGDKVSDSVAATMGSWRFIIIQGSLLIIWIIINTIAFFAHFDGYPYILLNLALSFQAAFATPIILMSQNRQSSKDRLTAEHDYQINLKSEQETRQLIAHLDEQDKQLLLAYEELIKQTSMLISLLEHKDMPTIPKTTVSEINDVESYNDSNTPKP
jgi:uncharacterized membrane protein